LTSIGCNWTWAIGRHDRRMLWLCSVDSSLGSEILHRSCDSHRYRYYYGYYYYLKIMGICGKSFLCKLAYKIAKHGYVQHKLRKPSLTWKYVISFLYLMQYLYELYIHILIIVSFLVPWMLYDFQSGSVTMTKISCLLTISFCLITLRFGIENPY